MAPHTTMRTCAFGERGEGLRIYVILDDQWRVVVLRALWIQ
jgi:hypothetical protein